MKKISVTSLVICEILMKVKVQSVSEGKIINKVTKLTAKVLQNPLVN